MQTGDFSNPLSEPVSIYPKPKKSGGGVRMIHKYGLRHRTAKDMVIRIMSAYYAPRPFQYTHLGFHAPIKRIKEAVKNGNVHIARLDIKDFYPSFDVEKLVPELPLPLEVVKHVVVGRHMKVVMDQEFMIGGHATPHLPHALTHDLKRQARLGLPQGSACSPIVGAFCMSRLEWFPVPGVLLFNYVDDFLLLSSSPVLLDNAVGKLMEAVADLPGGHFKLKLKAKSIAAKGFDFLGHHLRVVKDKLSTSPTVEIIEDLYAKIMKLDEVLSGRTVCKPGNKGKCDQQKALDILAQMFAIHYGRLKAFQECDNASGVTAIIAVSNADWCETLGVTTEQVKKVIEPWMTYRPNNYGVRASV